MTTLYGCFGRSCPRQGEVGAKWGWEWHRMGGAVRASLTTWSAQLCRPISLTVAKCWDPTPRSYFTIPRGELPHGKVG
jgi:hypothetical protein